MANSGADLARKLERAGKDLTEGSSKAVIETALVVKHSIVTAARSRTRFGSHVNDQWAGFRNPKLNRSGKSSTVVRVRGGFAHLAEFGSYKKPGGYEIGNRGTSHRRRKAALRRGETFKEGRVLAGPGFGPVRGPVHHPAQQATPFFDAGVAVARPIAAEVWRRSARRALAKNFKG